MTRKSTKLKVTIAISIVCLMLTGAVIPTALASIGSEYHRGFEQGISWQPMVPMKKTTFVNMDEESLLDDYAYLAAVPTAVFNDVDKERIFTHPLLFYEEEYDYSDIDEEEQYMYRSLNARQGIDYFMEDWMGYCGNHLDQMTLINVPKNKIDTSWNAKDFVEIEGETACDIASQIALHDWSYSDEAVIAVIEDSYEQPENETRGEIDGTVLKRDGVKTDSFLVDQTNKVQPQHNDFTVPSGYKLLDVRSWYPSFYIDAGLKAIGFESIVNMTIPAGDRDLQIWVKTDRGYMMAGITNAWNALSGMDTDKTKVYVYEPGTWSVSLTDAPTKSDIIADILPSNNDDEMELSGLEDQRHVARGPIKHGRYGKITDILKSFVTGVKYHVDVEMYPGVMVDVPDLPPFGCRDAYFKLEWDNPDVQLGFSLIGPSGEEILSSREPDVSSKCSFPDKEGDALESTEDRKNMYVERLGECVGDDKYQICVFAMSDISTDVDFDIEYTWKQNTSKMEGDGLASATEGAVLASILNTPLLYVNTTTVPSETMDTLYKLGVEDIYLVNLGDHLSEEAIEELQDVLNIEKEYKEYKEIYDCIRDRTGKNDVIFSTIDPWSYWYVAELEPEGEMEGSRFIGPSAFIAAQHGSPVLIVDNHPELSTSLIWHNELWQRHANGHSKLPTVTEMHLTGTRIYDFLKEYGFDDEGEETIITVAGQFDIGLPWDRVFVGKAKPGRFIGSPTDISVWLSKTIFYPQIVFENPGISNPNGVTVEMGTESKRRFPFIGKFGLKVTGGGEEVVEYPVLDTLICYDHKFNSRASKYWGFEYTCADGDIPGKTPSNHPIDDGVMIAVNGEEGGFYPADLSGSEVQPFYLERGGYTPVYSTSFEANMYNLNQGMLLWMVNTHGAPNNGGMYMFWDVAGNNPGGYPAIPGAAYKKETNPWRGYEWRMGSTAEPDTMTSEIHGIIPALLGNPEGNGFITTALDWAVAYRPFRDLIGKIASLPGLKLITPEWLQDTQDYYDGVIITVFLGRFGTSWYNGLQIDDALDNIHSAGISSVACLPAGKYMHLTLMRHGSPFQIMDPWATSWYSDVWQNSFPRGVALGQTIGEIYAEGISKVGILYVSDDEPQWWWDLAENVCLYGDPDLRVWVPSTEYSDDNNWEEEDIQSLRFDSNDGFAIDGHSPFGADTYPNEIIPKTIVEEYLIVIIALIAIVILVILAVGISVKKKA